MIEKKLILASILLFLTSQLFSQDILKTKWNPSAVDTSYKSIISSLEKELGLSFSYSSNILEDQIYFNLPKELLIKDLFDELFTAQNIEYELKSSKKILLFRKKRSFLEFSGVIRDGDTKESIPGASVSIPDHNKFISSTDEGYFYLRLPKIDSVYVVFNSLTYDFKRILFKESRSKMAIELYSNYDSPEIIITPINENDSEQQIQTPQEYLKNSNIPSFSPFGSEEELEKVKNQIMVQNGNEAQSGFVVQGGSPDQNLILLDGMNIYDISHVGGISSIFVSSAIKDMKFYTGNSPAEYSGRISSVLDVKINEGNTGSTFTKAGVSLAGADFHTEGPIRKNQTAYSLSGKYSWVGALAKPFLKRNFRFEESKINYFDFYAKVHHKITPTNRLSFTYYRGGDQINLFDRGQSTPESVSFNARNEIRWGNELGSLQWNSNIGKNVFSHLVIGFSNFNLTGIGTYSKSSLTEIDQDLTARISTESNIKSKMASLSINVYESKLGILKVGAKAIQHNFIPSLEESLFSPVSTIEVFTSAAEEFEAYELIGFAENDFELFENFRVKYGINISSFSLLNGINVEPRVKILGAIKNHQLELSGGFHHQYVHLLVNPGPALPSDLWIPSNGEDIPESRARSLELLHEYKFKKGWLFKSSAYFKRLLDLKEYDVESDIYYALLYNSDEVVGGLSIPPDWRDRIIIGQGFSFGFGASLNYVSAKIQGLISYHYSRTRHNFPTSNLNEEYFARHDRPNNLTVQGNFYLNKSWALAAKFIYGTGIRYTLPITRIPSSPPTFAAETRNSRTLPDFHHLNLSLTYTKSLEKSIITAQLSVYNVYNRKNVFYNYLIPSDDPNRFLEERNVGLLPILPNLNFTISY